jgi:hypothetical protein
VIHFWVNYAEILLFPRDHLRVSRSVTGLEFVSCLEGLHPRKVELVVSLVDYDRGVCWWIAWWTKLCIVE